jgi:hypothetical protein
VELTQSSRLDTASCPLFLSLPMMVSPIAQARQTWIPEQSTGMPRIRSGQQLGRRSSSTTSLAALDWLGGPSSEKYKPLHPTVHPQAGAHTMRGDSERQRRRLASPCDSHTLRRACFHLAPPAHLETEHTAGRGGRPWCRCVRPGSRTPGSVAVCPPVDRTPARYPRHRPATGRPCCGGGEPLPQHGYPSRGCRQRCRRWHH